MHQNLQNKTFTCNAKHIKNKQNYHLLVKQDKLKLNKLFRINSTFNTPHSQNSHFDRPIQSRIINRNQRCDLQRQFHFNKDRTFLKTNTNTVSEMSLKSMQVVYIRKTETSTSGNYVTVLIK
jgi:hypothetical protein